MKFNILRNTFCYLFLIVPWVFGSRQYDINEESLRLFGEDLATVVKRFRRTSEYLHILEEKRENLAVTVAEILDRTTVFFTEKLLKRAKEMVLGDVGYNTTVTITISTKGDHKGHRQGEGHSITTEDPIKKLEEYDKLHKSSTAQELMDYHKLGFDVARELVHSVIKAMGPEDEQKQATDKKPDKGKTTTRKHVSSRKPSKGHGGHMHHESVINDAT